MQISDLKNKMVGILGYGMEGKAIVKYLLKHNIKFVIFDQKPWEKWDKKEQDEIKQLELNFIFGQDAFLELGGFDVAFRSPGISILNPQIQKQIKNGLKVTSQTKFFFDNCPGMIIGVTGTKGKGTTSALIHQTLTTNQYPLTTKAYLTGNIGYIQPLDILDDLTPNDFVVYELSSFQLQDLEKSPHISVVLMTTSEHLDYHKNITEYLIAKANITKFQTSEDYAIINADFPNSKLIGKNGSAKKLYFSTKIKADCYVKNEKIIYNDLEIDPKKLILKGKHNWENIAAAILTVKILGIKNESIIFNLLKFKGLKHRLEFVAEKQGIKYYNDSFSTTPETAVAAVKSFEEPLVLILGGSSKKSDFAELFATIEQAKNINAIILIGEEAARIKKGLNFKGKIFENAKNMNEIFAQINICVNPGDVVLLSPGCASFGMFNNYQDRGNQFIDFVLNKQINNKQ